MILLINDFETIQEEQTTGKLDFKNVEAKVDYIQQSKTELSLSDDWRRLSFSDMDYIFHVGKRYKFYNNIWLMVNSDYTFNTNGKAAIVRRCNNTLNMVDEWNNVIQEPCVIDPMPLNASINYGTNLDVQNGKIFLVTQYNDNTKNIAINSRFLFGHQAFKVIYLQNYILSKTYDKNSVSLIGLFLNIDSTSPTDNIPDNVAGATANIFSVSISPADFSQSVGYTGQLTATVSKNNATISTPVVWSSSDSTIGTIDSNGNVTLLAKGSVMFTATMEKNPSIKSSITVTVTEASPVVTKTNAISPNTTTLTTGDTQAYTVYSYSNGVKNTDTFTITASGVSNPSSYYTMTTSDNGFSINCITGADNPLVVTCTNKVDDTTVSITINLMMW